VTVFTGPPPRHLTAFLWLGLAGFLFYWSSIDAPIAIAAWLAPVCLMKFTRSRGALVGMLTSLALVMAAGYGATRSMAPMGTMLFLTLLAIDRTVYLLPYVADRLASEKLPPIQASLLFPAGIVCAEFGQLLLKDGLSWWSSAYSQHGIPALLQVASITGIWGVVFLIHWLAPVVNAAWTHGISTPSGARPAIAFTATLLLVLVAGEARLTLARIEKTVRAAGIVPPPDLDWLTVDALRPPVYDRDSLRATGREYEAASQRIQDRLFELTENEARAGAQLVVWSEMAAWTFIADEPALLARASDSARRLGLHLVVAIATLRPTEDRVVDNKAILFAPDGSGVWQYRKSHPVPGAEEALSLRGDGRATVARTPSGRVGAAICFDMDYPEGIRRMPASDMDVMVVPSHDFQAVRDLHARMAVFRAIENGVGLFRPTADGVSIATDGYGRTLALTGYLRSGGSPLVAQMPIRGVRTIYSRWGDWLVWISAAAFTWLALRGLKRRRAGAISE
jgi:apolipoprotein N-acyltransferase